MIRSLTAEIPRENREPILNNPAFQVLFALIWTRYTIVNFIIVLLSKIIPGISDTLVYIFPVAIVFCTLFSMPYINKCIGAKDLLAYLESVAFIILTMLIYPNNAVYILDHLWFILVSVLPMYFIGLSFDFEKNEKWLFWISFIGVFTTFLYQFYYLSSGRELIHDNMSAAYNVLPSVSILVYSALKKNKLFNWMAAVIGMVLLLVFGTRGSIAGLAIFIIAYIFINIVSLKSNLKKIIYTLFSIAILYSIFVTNILINFAKWASDIFSGIGFSTRIFNYFIMGKIIYDNGRNPILEIVLQAIKEKPLLGYGLMGDRKVIEALFFNESTYTHNIVIELWCQFGVIFGSLILFIMLFIIFLALKKSDNSNKYFILMFATIVFVKLFFSGSYILEPYLFFMLGMCIQIIRNSNKKIRIV